MSRARGDSGLDGFLNICKEPGPSSHDVVAAARRLLGTRRAGHAGTLDPFAEGVLPLAFGRATRLIDRFATAEKEYYAEALLGTSTTTDDRLGEVLEERESQGFSESEIRSALAEFTGDLEQRPPAYSAIKVEGRRAYELARRGQDMTLAPRRVTIYEINLLDWSWPILRFQVRCGKGTYIRALVRDLGDRLEVGASLQRLVRLRVGPFRLESSIRLEQVVGTSSVFPADAFLTDSPAICLDDDAVEHLRHGRSWPTAAPSADLCRAYTRAGVFAGVLGSSDGRWQPKLNFLDQ